MALVLARVATQALLRFPNNRRRAALTSSRAPATACASPCNTICNYNYAVALLTGPAVTGRRVRDFRSRKLFSCYLLQLLPTCHCV